MLRSPTKSSDFSYSKLVDHDEEEGPGFSFLKPSPSSSSSWGVFKISYRVFIRITVALPLSAFLFCVAWALWKDPIRATTVLCIRQDNRLVRNYLPSLSAAVGDFLPSRDVWVGAILLHFPPRLIIIGMYLGHLRRVVEPRFALASVLTCATATLENLGLLLLSLVSSKRNLPIHAVGFTTFVVCSQVYMVALCTLLSPKCRRGEITLTKLEEKGLRLKRRLLGVILVSSLLLVLAYQRHSSHCEEGVYTIFAALEYLVVLANIAFHGSSFYDFYDRVLVLDLFSTCRVRLPTGAKAMTTWNY